MSLDKQVFYGCNSIVSMTCLRVTPPECKYGNPFSSSSYKDAILYVPSQTAKSKYSSATYWKDFKEIKVIGETGQITLTASPSGGQVEKGTKVTLTAKANGSTISADIYYTTNGTTPTKYSTKYTSYGVTINESCTLKAIAYKDGYEMSDVLTAAYTVTEQSEFIRQVAAGGNQTMILKNDGSLWACGDNTRGQLGDGTTTNRSTPKKVMDGVTSVSVGTAHTMCVG